MRTIYRSTTFDAPVADVWAVIRDFNDWPAWLPALLFASEMEGGESGTTVGGVRVLTVEGGTARERLLALSDHEHSLSYSVEEAEIPITDYVATIRLREITDGDRTFAEWRGSFNAAPEAEAEIGESIATMVYEGGFAGVRERLAARVG